MATLSKNIVTVFKKYPVVRGMISYGIMWPTSCFIQQTLEGKRFDSDNNYDWLRCARFGLYGSCYVAPTLYSWLTIANIMWPGTSVKAALFKTFFETISYTPFAMCSFYFSMSLLEMKSFDEAVAEVKSKFWPTYKVGASTWPAIAMINYIFIPPKNRVPFISVCSLIWTCFLAYMKELDKNKMPEHSPTKLLKM
ncbi:unnamed protein product, partial [Brenthis ino]